MKKIKIETSGKSMLGDIYTPVGIYLRLRDKFRDTILLESTDHHAAENSFSFICINAIAGIEISSSNHVEFKFPGEQPEKINIGVENKVPNLIWEFMQKFEASSSSNNKFQFAQGLFGYTTFDAVQFFDTVPFTQKDSITIPLMRYRLYQYVIAFNHFKDELILCENNIHGIESDISLVESP